jgi:uncharacterized protein YkwD
MKVQRLILALIAIASAAACSVGLPDWLRATRREHAYTVLPGDTLSEIADLHGTTPEQLTGLNDTRYPSLRDNPGLIRVGWELIVPRGSVDGGGEQSSEGFGGAPGSLPGATPSADAVDDVRQVELDIIRLTNEARRAEGRPELVEDPVLTAIARERAKEIVSHYSHDGFVEACERHSVAGQRWLAKNIAAIPASAALPGSGTLPQRFVVKGWLQSEGHRASILDPRFTAIGVGVTFTGHRWTAAQVFRG